MPPLKRIRVIIPWFGPWPAWLSLFLQSCRWNPSVDFLLVGDQPPPEDVPANVAFLTVGFDDYRRMIAGRLGIRPRWTDPYKICDIRPAFGFLHADLVEGYDYWGYGDLDVIYGDIRHFYTPDVLVHDVISTHSHVASGHFLLVRNTPRMRTAFRRILHWRYLLSSAKHKSFDERIFSLLFIDEEHRRERGLHRFLAPKLGGALLREQFSTSIPGLPWVDGSQNYPTEWCWRKGRLTSNRSEERQFLYCHFTHWNSKRWSGGHVAPWHKLERLVQIDSPRPEAFKISAAGFAPLLDG